MKRIPYNAEISHCEGAGTHLCRRCYRYRLLQLWRKQPVQTKEVILLMPARMENASCSRFYDLSRVTG